MKRVIKTENICQDKDFLWQNEKILMTFFAFLYLCMYVRIFGKNWLFIRIHFFAKKNFSYESFKIKLSKKINTWLLFQISYNDGIHYKLKNICKLLNFRLYYFINTFIRKTIKRINLCKKGYRFIEIAISLLFVLSKYEIASISDKKNFNNFEILSFF